MLVALSPFLLQLIASVREQPLRTMWALLLRSTWLAAAVREATLLFVTEKGFISFRRCLLFSKSWKGDIICLISLLNLQIVVYNCAFSFEMSQGCNDHEMRPIKQSRSLELGRVLIISFVHLVQKILDTNGRG